MREQTDLFAGQKTFGRRGGRPLSQRQKTLWASLLPEIAVPENETNIDPKKLFSPNNDEIWLEIGFGGGEHVAGQAMRNSQVGFLASEIFIEGIAKLLGQIEAQKLKNIRLWPDDARLLIRALQPETVDRVFLLFPDPWPKKRQQKRRIVQPEFLDELSRILKTGGSVRFATDVRSYADAALECFLAHPSFSWTASHPCDWRNIPRDHLRTRYQTKQLGDIEPVYFDFICKP